MKLSLIEFLNLNCCQFEKWSIFILDDNNTTPKHRYIVHGITHLNKPLKDKDRPTVGKNLMGILRVTMQKLFLSRNFEILEAAGKPRCLTGSY